MSVSYCVEQNKACVGWVEKYFKDCLCNVKDEFSFGFGLISLLCWGVAEIPQIFTNFRTKSSHGVSLAFLLTWVAGDVFNLVGCLLEPATLPTQYYTALSSTLWPWVQYFLLYTTSTIVLVVQSLYYDYIYRCLKRRRINNANQTGEEDQRKPLKHCDPSGRDRDSAIPIPRTPSTKITTSSATPRRDFYYTSARSLAGSGTPPFRTYMRAARSGPSALGVETDSSSSDDEVNIPVRSNKSLTQPRPIPNSAASYGTFLAASLNLPKSNALTHVYIGLGARKLLSQNNNVGESHTVYGQWLGWMMAAIYMGGRLPQIWLNIKRGNVEGLNPLMFVFALIANVTYVASILVRSTEWTRIKANMPWLLDAVVCVVLDLFIILQYIYFKNHWRRTRSGQDSRDNCYNELSKAEET